MLPDVFGRSRGSLAATVLWMMVCVVTGAWLATLPAFRMALQVAAGVLAFLGTVVLWNVDALREAWRQDRDASGEERP